MIIVKQLMGTGQPAPDQRLIVELPYDLRKKSRLRTKARCGRDVGFQLPRGSALMDGQRFVAESGEVVEVIASAETVSKVTCDQPLLLLKAAYHLGNRHVPLQVTEHWLRYQHDHVLDDMVRGLGLQVSVEQAPFQPESGAYHRHGAGHSHNHHHHEH
ncbi:MAG: urease accessory protein UreE [Porticoccaceae bacterium]|nr:urease accessory protein UreE [Porticoccaceae bacterium]